MPTYKTRVHRDGRRRDETQPYLHTARHSMSPTAKLAVAIVQQAVEDWDGLIKRKAWRLGGQQPVSTQSSAAGANAGSTVTRSSSRYSSAAASSSCSCRTARR